LKTPKPTITIAFVGRWPACPGLTLYFKSWDKEYVTDPLPGKILEAIRTNTGQKDIIVVEYRNDHGNIQ
jgi:hypothetical protein